MSYDQREETHKIRENTIPPGADPKRQVGDRGRKIDLDEAIKRADEALAFLKDLKHVESRLQDSTMYVHESDGRMRALNPTVKTWLLQCISNKTAEVSSRLQTLIDGTMGGKV